MNKIILVKKYSPESICWQNLFRKKAIKELTVECIVSKYQGFEGDSVLFYTFVGSNSGFDLIVNKYKESIKPLGDDLLICACLINSIRPDYLENNFTQVGFDFGVCEEDRTIYSSIFNEILFGCVTELVCYRDYLNEHLLFSNLNFAKNYAIDHHKLYLQGKDIEEDNDMNIFEIWKFNGKSTI